MLGGRFRKRRRGRAQTIAAPMSFVSAVLHIGVVALRIRLLLMKPL